MVFGMPGLSSSLVSTFVFPERAARETDPFESNWVGFWPPENRPFSIKKGGFSFLEFLV